jgi:intracellular septation protein
VSAAPPSPGLKLGLEYGPLLVFLAITFFAPAAPMLRLVESTPLSLAGLRADEALLIARVVVATGAFVAATVTALVVSRVKLGAISPMLWLSSILVIVFGGLTIWFRDPHFIKMKPTIVYVLMSMALLFGLWSGRPLLRDLMGAAYPGLTARGWAKLTRNWAFFFLAMAGANEAVWRWTEASLSPEAALRAWTLYKMPGCLILTLVFAVANVPMLMRHGLNAGDAAKALPPEG